MRYPSWTRLAKEQSRLGAGIFSGQYHAQSTPNTKELHISLQFLEAISLSRW